jgi:NhaP-type Na+/H+ or K+/H+ antiporter|tara:strand:- start:379 stop:591 length:213 start_codon:yes stop_codon:yes gene_type:complete
VKKTGLVLILITVALLLGYGAYEMILDQEMSLLVKIAVVGLYLGFVIVFIAVLLQRIKEQKSDKYIEVEK